MGERRWEQRFREREGREGWKVRRARENCRLECPDAELDKNAARNRWTTHRSGHRGASAAARAHEHSHEIRVHENCVKGRRTEEMGRRTARAHRPTIDSFFLAAAGRRRQGYGGGGGGGRGPAPAGVPPRRAAVGCRERRLHSPRRRRRWDHPADQALTLTEDPRTAPAPAAQPLAASVTRRCRRRQIRRHTEASLMRKLNNIPNQLKKTASTLCKGVLKQLGDLGIVHLGAARRGGGGSHAPNVLLRAARGGEG